MRLCIYLPDEIAGKLTQESQVRNQPISKIVAEALSKYLGIEEKEKENDYASSLKEIVYELDNFIRNNPGCTFTVNTFEGFKNLTPAVKAAVGRKVSTLIRTVYRDRVSIMYNEDGSIVKSETNATYYFVNLMEEK